MKSHVVGWMDASVMKASRFNLLPHWRVICHSLQASVKISHEPQEFTPPEHNPGGLSGCGRGAGPPPSPPRLPLHLPTPKP